METVEVADVAAVLADRTRAAICVAMLDGRAWTVGELARTSGVAASSASEQVARLRQAGFVETLRQGRHRYVRISDPRVAELVERLAEHAAHRHPRGLRESVRARRLAFARTCYDHLAGRLGVALRDGMLAAGLIDDTAGLTLTGHGRVELGKLAVPVPESGRRPVLRDCLDWTERREHLGGALPAALLRRATDAGWLTVGPGRAVRLPDAGRGPLARLGLDLGALVDTERTD